MGLPSARSLASVSADAFAIYFDILRMQPCNSEHRKWSDADTWLTPENELSPSSRQIMRKSKCEALLRAFQMVCSAREPFTSYCTSLKGNFTINLSNNCAYLPHFSVPVTRIKAAYNATARVSRKDCVRADIRSPASVA